MSYTFSSNSEGFRQVKDHSSILFTDNIVTRSLEPISSSTCADRYFPVSTTPSVLTLPATECFRLRPWTAGEFKHHSCVQQSNYSFTCLSVKYVKHTLVRFSWIQGNIYALGKTHMHSNLSDVSTTSPLGAVLTWSLFVSMDWSTQQIYALEKAHTRSKPVSLRFSQRCL